jgi:phosphatidate cytidylyltransferase
MEYHLRSPELQPEVRAPDSIRGAVAVALLAAMVAGLSIALVHSGHGLNAAGFTFDSRMVRVAASIYSFIGACSAISFLHPRLRRPEARPIRQAINTWWAPALACGPAALFGAPAAVPLFAVVSAWTLHEYLGLLPAEDRHPVTDAVAYASVPIHYLTLALGKPSLFFGVLLLWIGAVLPLTHAFVRGPPRMLGAVPRLQFGVLLTVLALSHVARIFLLPPSIGPSGGAGVGTLLLICVMSSDAAQYVSGKLFGRHKLAPVISPKKTWEGLAGGALVTGLVAAAVARLITPFHPAVAALIGVAFSVTGLLGDLLISAVKRDAGVKDTGAVLPGQGGILDRCDSLILTAPLFAHALELWAR